LKESVLAVDWTRECSERNRKVRHNERSVPAAEVIETSTVEAARRLGIDLNRLFILLRLGRIAGRNVNGQGHVCVLSRSV